MRKIVALMAVLITGNLAFTTKTFAKEEKGGEVGNPVLNNNPIAVITCDGEQVFVNSNGESKLLMSVTQKEVYNVSYPNDNPETYCLRLSNNINKAMVKVGDKIGPIPFKCISEKTEMLDGKQPIYSIGVQSDSNDFERIGYGATGMFNKWFSIQCEELAKKLNENFDSENVKSRSVASKECAVVSESKEKNTKELSIVNSARNLSKEVQPEVKKHISPVSKTSDR